MISVSGTLSSNSESKNPGLFLVFDGKNDSSHVLNYTGLSSNTLYTSDFLSPGHHTLAMTLMTNDTTLFIQGMNVTVMNEGITADAAADDRSYAAAQRTRVGEIVGGTLGGLTFIALILVSFFLYRRRKLQRAKGPLQIIRPRDLYEPKDDKQSHTPLDLCEHPCQPRKRPSHPQSIITMGSHSPPRQILPPTPSRSCRPRQLGRVGPQTLK